MNVQCRVTCAVLSVLILSGGSTALAVSSEDQIEVKPELIYRMAGVSLRDGSAFYRSTRNKDFIDQLYLSLKLQRTFRFRNLIHFEPSFSTGRYAPDEETMRIDQAYLQSVLGERWYILAGRKVEFHGSGYVFNPSDLINESKDIIDTLNQRTGQNFTRLSYHGENFVLGLAYLPQIGLNADHGTGWLLLETYLGGVELQFQSTYSQKLAWTYGVSLAGFLQDGMELHFDGRLQTKERTTAELQERDFSEHRGQSFYGLIGTRLIVSPRRTVIAEAIWNEAGLFPEELERYFEAQKQIERDKESHKDEPFSRMVGRQYMFLAFNDEQSLQGVRLGFNWLANLMDQSHFVSTSLKWASSPIISLSYSPTAFIGKASSEFGEQPARMIHYVLLEGRF